MWMLIILALSALGNLITNITSLIFRLKKEQFNPMKEVKRLNGQLYDLSIDRLSHIEMNQGLADHNAQLKAEISMHRKTIENLDSDFKQTKTELLMAKKKIYALTRTVDHQ